MDLQQLREKAAAAHKAAVEIQNRADVEKRALTEEEAGQIDALSSEVENTLAEIDRRERIENLGGTLAQSAGRKTSPSQPGGGQPANAGLRNTVLPTAQQKARAGFHNFGEFAVAVKNAVLSPGNMDGRLIANASLSTYGSEGVGSDGGFAVPPEWRTEIMQMVDGEDSLLSRCDRQPVSGNSLTVPTDETTAWQTTGGIQTYWDSEAATITQSKPQLKDLTIKLHRLTALVPVTEELLEDAPAMAGYVPRKAGEKLAFKVNDAIINGTGVGQPLGILNAPCTVSVAKEGSQTATTFHADNAVKMMARMPAQSYSRAVWLVNQDVVPQILKLGFAVTTAAGAAAGAGALYLPPNGLAASTPYGLLLGRPIVVTEACATLGTVGDVILADLTKYLAAVKGGLRQDASIHLWFDQAVTAFRFIVRMNGQPWLSAAIARKNGANTLSHFVTVATRT